LGVVLFEERSILLADTFSVYEYVIHDSMNWKWIDLSCVIIGVGFFLLAVYSYYMNFEFLVRSQKVYGTVISVDVVSERPLGTLHYYPQIKFIVKSGQSATFTSSVGEQNTNPFAYQVGDKIVVEYDPNDLSRAEIASVITSSVSWVSTIIFFLLGICALILPIGLKVKFKKS